MPSNILKPAYFYTIAQYLSNTTIPIFLPWLPSFSSKYHIDPIIPSFSNPCNQNFLFNPAEMEIVLLSIEISLYIASRHHKMKATK